jgi:processive 1,2-diacylglycerol beta-glucosyltransferase
MVMGGGLGLGGISDLAHTLMKWKDRVQLIICTGYNHSLRISLERNNRFQHPHIIITGFVDNIDELLDAADLLISKPGGLTCLEALSKGVPMLMYKPIPGHEEYNSDHLAKHQLAIRIYDLQEVDHWIEKLLFFPEAFERLYENMKQYQQNMNPLAGVKAVINLLAQ